jgi:hypothetical protein
VREHSRVLGTLERVGCLRDGNGPLPNVPILLAEAQQRGSARVLPQWHCAGSEAGEVEGECRYSHQYQNAPHKNLVVNGSAAMKFAAPML